MDLDLASSRANLMATQVWAPVPMEWMLGPLPRSEPAIVTSYRNTAKSDRKVNLKEHFL